MKSSAFYSVFSTLINPITFTSCIQKTEFSPFYISVTFTNFKRLNSLDNTFYNSFVKYIGFKPIYVFKKYRQNSFTFENMTFVRSAKYIFFSSIDFFKIQHFFNIFFFFKSPSNETFLSLSTKFSRGTSLFQFSDSLLEPFTVIQQYGIKNFVEFDEEKFFSRNFSNYKYLLNNHKIFFFLIRFIFCHLYFFSIFSKKL